MLLSPPDFVIAESMQTEQKKISVNNIRVAYQSLKLFEE
jgi:hypothetical protein